MLQYFNSLINSHVLKKYFYNGSDLSDDEPLVPATSAGISKWRGRGHSSRRARGVDSTTRSDEEAFPPERWTTNMTSSTDVAFTSRVGSWENFRPDESGL